MTLIHWFIIYFLETLFSGSCLDSYMHKKKVKAIPVTGREGP
jgi:hypothetical protein